MPSIIFSGGKKPRENNRLRNDTYTLPFEFVNWPWKKNCGFSQLSACFSPDPPTSRLPSPSYNTRKNHAPVYFCDPSNSISETLNNDNCSCCVYFYSHDCHVKFYEKGGQCTKFSFTLRRRRRRRNSVKSKIAWSSARLSLHGVIKTTVWQRPSSSTFVFLSLFDFLFSPTLPSIQKSQMSSIKSHQSLMDIFPAVLTERNACLHLDQHSRLDLIKVTIPGYTRLTSVKQQLQEKTSSLEKQKMLYVFCLFKVFQNQF